MRSKTGAGSAGLGFGSAKALADEGVKVAICGRDKAKLDRAVADIGNGCVGFVCDVSTIEGAREFIAKKAAVEVLNGDALAAAVALQAPAVEPAPTVALGLPAAPGWLWAEPLIVRALVALLVAAALAGDLVVLPALLGGPAGRLFRGSRV